jgi:hypothetical protein
VVGDYGTGITTTPPRVETALNQSANPILMGHVTVSPAQFAIPAGTDRCSGVTLAPGASCTVSVDFTAWEPKAYSGQMNFPSNSPGGMQYVGLKGQGNAALINQSPNFLFSSTVVGATSLAKTVTMSNLNASPVTLTVNGWELLGSCGPAVNVTTDNCTGTVLQPKTASPANTCTMLLTFTPTAATTCTETLEVNSSGGNSPSTITMTGTGTLSALTLSPTSLLFGIVPHGTTSAAKTITVTNPNTIPGATVTISGIATSNSVFGVASTTCGSSLAPSGTCTINVNFAPVATGSTSGSLNITDNAGTGTQKAALYGTGS